MLNQFLQSTIGHDAMGDYLNQLLINELDILSPLRTKATIKENLPISAMSHYDNSCGLAFIIDDQSLKNVKETRHRILVPIFELDSMELQPIELDWSQKLKQVFDKTFKNILEKETNIINELISALDDQDKYEIVLAIRTGLTSNYVNDENNKMIEHYQETKNVKEELAEEAKNEGFYFFEQIGVAAIKKKM
jgi:hypothetical protein